MAARTQPDGPTLQKRRSDRVFIRIPLSILGADQDGRNFEGRAVTEMVSRFGASIVTKLPLFPEQELTLLPPDNKRIRARVIGQTSIGREGHVYGIAFLNTTIEHWGIHFPPIAEPISASARVECCSCRTSEVVQLSELEFEVFRANDRLRRICARCGDLTTWQLAEGAAPSKPPQLSRQPVPAGGHPEPPQPAAVTAAGRPPQQQRMYSRVQVKMKACIAQPGTDDDVVNTINVSRGGVLVRSERIYPRESWVQLAVPYTPAAANIFVPARVVWRGDVEGAHQYGLQYLRS